MYDNIILFIKLVNAGGFSQVARQNKVSQSTITRKIQSLEKELETKLIKRNTRHLVLTKSGGLLYENFKNYESIINELMAPLYKNGVRTLIRDKDLG